jgi:diguanylate cyclase
MATDWRSRFIDLEQRSESAQRERETAERELTRLITRLCVACSGFDPQLDRELERLRKVARKGEAGAVVRQSEAFADAIVRASEERVRPGVLSRLLTRAGETEKQAAATLQLWSEVAADPAAASDAQLDALAAALQSVARSDPGQVATTAGSRPTLFGRLLGRTVPAAVEPRRLLREIIDQVDWPREFGDQVAEFRRQLDADGDAWTRVVHEIGDLAARALAQAQASARSTEHFLTELSQRLEELDRHMLDEDRRRGDSLSSGSRLGQRMDSEVVSLTETVRSSASLADLQASVISSLDRIQQHVRQHLDEESQRRNTAEREAATLRMQMTQLERDSYDLRRQVAESAREATRDPLTGLPNRRAYDAQLLQEVARWRRFGEPLALLVFDVDDFKQVNDRFGHKSGDKALAMIAKVLAERRRETDLVARYGGEEFVVLLPGAPQPDALRIADDMRRAVADCGMHANRQPVPITLSGGLAMFAQGDEPAAVFERADRALYRAKRNGKNRVELGDVEDR